MIGNMQYYYFMHQYSHVRYIIIVLSHTHTIQHVRFTTQATQGKLTFCFAVHIK